MGTTEQFLKLCARGDAEAVRAELEAAGGTLDPALLSQGMAVARIAGAREVLSLLDAAEAPAAASASTQCLDKDEYIARVSAAIEPAGDYGSDELVSDREIDGSVELTVTPDLEVECTHVRLEAACIEAVQRGLRSVGLWDEALTVSLSERPELEYVNSTEDQVSRETRFRFEVLAEGMTLWSATAHVDFIGFVEDVDEDDRSISACMVYVVNAKVLSGNSAASSGSVTPGVSRQGAHPDCQTPESLESEPDRDGVETGLLLDQLFGVWLEGDWSENEAGLLDRLASGPLSQILERISDVIGNCWAQPGGSRWLDYRNLHDNADRFLCGLIKGNALSERGVQWLKRIALHEDPRQTYDDLPTVCVEVICQTGTIRDTRALLEAFVNCFPPRKGTDGTRLLRNDDPNVGSFDKMEWPYELPMTEDEEAQYENRIQQYVQLDIRAGNRRS